MAAQLDTSSSPFTIPPSRHPAAQYSLSPPTSMKHTVRPTALSFDALRAVAPLGQNSGKPSFVVPSLGPPPRAFACAFTTRAASTTPRQITRPLSLGGPSSMSAARTALLIPSAPTTKSAITESFVSPSRVTNVHRALVAPFSYSTSSMPSSDASRWMQCGGRNDASAACASAHRMQIRPAPCWALMMAGNAPPASLATAFLRAPPMPPSSLDDVGAFADGSSTMPMRMPVISQPRDATSSATSSPITRRALTPFGHIAMPVPALDLSAVARS